LKAQGKKSSIFFSLLDFSLKLPAKIKIKQGILTFFAVSNVFSFMPDDYKSFSF